MAVDDKDIKMVKIDNEALVVEWGLEGSRLDIRQ